MRLVSGLLLVLTAAQASAQSPQDRALYEVEFDGTWSATTHPSAYPNGAHFSPLIGATHTSAVNFWEPGQLASPGIEAMAEIGATTTLAGEVGAAVLAGTAEQVLLGQGFFSPSSTVLGFELTPAFPLVTLVSMIAPSPDWFVGVRDVALFEGGQWVEELVVPLYAWDAGTDSGPDFTSLNQNTVPAIPIAKITGGPFFGTTPLGTFTFRRKWSTLSFGCGINPAGSLVVLGGRPTIGRSLSVGVNDPTASMGLPSLTFFAVSPSVFPGFPCGVTIQGWGLGAPGSPGEFFLTSTGSIVSGPTWNGALTPFQISIPNDLGLVGQSYFMQGALVDGTPRFGLTEGLELHIGL